MNELAMEPVVATKRAWLYCTYGDMAYMGEIKNEGSLHELVSRHEELFDESHHDHYHVIVEDTPEYNEVLSHAHSISRRDGHPCISNQKLQQLLKQKREEKYKWQTII
jgi:hypothetical protein